jgi:hypothetical protein
MGRGAAAAPMKRLEKFSPYEEQSAKGEIRIVFGLVSALSCTGRLMAAG